ncbi:MAG: RimK/LysX family protein [Methanobacteriaceae archaeon]
MINNDLKKQLEFTINEKNLIKKLNIPEEVFLPLMFSIRFGGDWSVKNNSNNIMAIKEKITQFNEEEKIGYTLEKIYLFVNPKLLKEEGKIYRLEKCSTKKERELVERPYSVSINGDYILLANLNPESMKISLKELKGS